MANWALAASKRAIQRHGLELNYTTMGEVIVDENEGTATPTSVTRVLRMYPKQIKADQFNYPNLIGKQAVMFYLANDNLGFKVKPSDTIEYLGETYRVNSYQGHTAQGEVVLFKILAVKG